MLSENRVEHYRMKKKSIIVLKFEESFIRNQNEFKLNDILQCNVAF
jgi:hypothetical protein